MFNNFTFYNPVKLIFGKGTIAQLTKNIKEGSKIMLTYGGGSIFKNGVYDQVIEALKGYEIVEFGGIEVNPTYETLMQAVELAKKEKVDFLLSVGGGSVLDGTKFISAAIPYAGENHWDLVLNSRKIGDVVPIGAVLTLPATGSEMNYYAVISKKATNEKKGMGGPKLYPQFSILDPETTYSLPKKQVANGLADAFTHVMEQYMTYPVGAMIQDRFAESILQTLIDVAPDAMNKENDYESRANYMWAATVALNGLINLGVPTDWATHQVGHELTAFHGIDHARTLAIVMPHLLTYKKDKKREKLIQYGKRVWHLMGPDNEIVEMAIAKTAEFYESLGIPTKASAYEEINAETIQKVKQRFVERGMNFGENADISPDDIEKILEMSLA